MYIRNAEAACRCRYLPPIHRSRQLFSLPAIPVSLFMAKAVRYGWN